MITTIPHWIEVIFLIALITTIVLFYLSNGRPKKLTIAIVGWAVLHSVLALKGFYLNVQPIPPRFAFILIPVFSVVVYGLLPAQRTWYTANRNLTYSSLLHSIRLAIEIVLFGLYSYQLIPELMTFEGRNFDILMGITAPAVGWLHYTNRINKYGLLLWNIVGLFFIVFIMINGILSAELPFQQFGFDQPNRGMTYFPFVLLPAVIVPIVLWTHLSDVTILISQIKGKKPQN